MLGHILASLAFAISVGGICFLVAHYMSPRPFFTKPFKTTFKIAFNAFASMAILSFLTIAITNLTILVVIHVLIAACAIGFTFLVTGIATGVSTWVRGIWQDTK
ncbi:MAG: hypothetical protein K2X77_32825 [Candidatus Obscuribacterales bacterium]|jgi:hypothetical protein|nr:hypothetical protein [Candidatus Obscuribacterales bacterium]